MASSDERGMGPFVERYGSLTQTQTRRRGQRSTNITNTFTNLSIHLPSEDQYSSHSKKSFKYAPIPDSEHIRLLYLKPAATDPSELHGYLRLHKLNQHSIYEAISYAWGDFRHLKRVIHLNGKVLKITDNLFAALMAYSHPDRVRVLWVDAICINQTDPLEKAQQVALMANIYSRASMVQVWLSPASRWAMEAMAFLRRLSSQAEIFGTSADVGHARRIYGWPVINISNEDAENLIDGAIVHHVDFLLRCSWFKRVWVVQEVALATDLVVSCGHTTIPWVNMARALEVLHGAYRKILRGTTRDSISGIKAAWETVRYRDEFRYVDQHLERSHHWATNLAARQMRSKRCTDDRDRVYAMLAMIRSPIEMKPDYTKTVAETYTEFAQKFSPNSQLYFAGLARRQPERNVHATIIIEDDQTSTLDITDRDYLPSWVPEFRPVPSQWLPQSRPVNNLAWTPTFGGTYAAASRLPFFFLNHPSIPKIMHATGAILDTISTTSPAFPPMHPPSYFLSPVFFFQLINFLNHHLANPPSSFVNSPPSSLPYAISLAKTLTAGIADCPDAETLLADYNDIKKHLSHLQKGSLLWLIAIWYAFETHALSPTGELYQAILLHTLARSSQTHSAPDTRPLDYTILHSSLSPDAQVAANFLNFLANVLAPERLFTTRGGRIGLVPKMVRPGDGVAVVNGCQTPFVVRRVGRVRCEGEEAEGAVQVIGACYVQGWMTGEIGDGRERVKVMGEDGEEEDVKWTRYPGDEVDSLYGWLVFV